MLLCSCVIVRGGVCVCEWNLRMNGRAYKISFHIESIRMNFLFSSDEIISCCFTCSARWIGYPCCKWRVSRSIIWKLWTRDQMNEGFLGSCAAADCCHTFNNNSCVTFFCASWMGQHISCFIQFCVSSKRMSVEHTLCCCCFCSMLLYNSYIISTIH